MMGVQLCISAAVTLKAVEDNLKLLTIKGNNNIYKHSWVEFAAENLPRWPVFGLTSKQINGDGFWMFFFLEIWINVDKIVEREEWQGEEEEEGEEDKELWLRMR